LCQLGKTVFLTTHYMDEAQYLADRVAVMRAGEIIALGRPDELGGRDVRPAEIRFVLPPEWSLGDLPDVPAGYRSLEADHALLQTNEPVLATQLITTWAIERDVKLGRPYPVGPASYATRTGRGSQAQKPAAATVSPLITNVCNCPVSASSTAATIFVACTSKPTRRLAFAMAGSSYAVVDRRGVAAARHERHPTTSVGEPAPSTPQAGRTLNPYCLGRRR
jgi:hypothetical protein